MIKYIGLYILFTFSGLRIHIGYFLSSNSIYIQHLKFMESVFQCLGRNSVDSIRSNKLRAAAGVVGMCGGGGG